MSEEKRNNHKRKKIAFGIFFLVIAVGLAAGFFYVRYKKTHISTDDAFVEGTVYTVSSRIDGTVKEVFVRDNQFVKKGELLVRLDRSPYEKKLNEAQAVLRAQKAVLDELRASLRAQKKKVEAAQAELSRRLTEKEELVALVSARKAELKATEAEHTQARLDLRRAERLYKKGVIPRDKYDRADTAYKTIEAKVEASKALLEQAKTRLRG
ncbi:MAG: HlyD family secretion protein, partial [Nitrospirae bacterium]